MKKIAFLSFSLLFIFYCSDIQAQKDDLFESALVHVSSGFLQGVKDTQTGLNYFWGVPYAEAPIGDLRWREPLPKKPWKGIRPANKFGNRAMQKFIYSDMRFRSDTISENSLFLNIWTPAKKAEEKLPVLIYFYGGGFLAGDGSEWRYDGAEMAKRGIITVTVNYRLGVFGFFAHPDLTEESPNKASGNYTLLDQSAAIDWVHKNIHAFGGDPDKITIAGESAGSISVTAQMASPLSRDKIAGAIGESGAMIHPTIPPISLKEAEERGLEFAKKLGAKNLKELRNMPAELLMEKAYQEDMRYFSPVIDGYFFPESPETIFKNGNQAAVPLLVGWNSMESSYQAILGDQKPTKDNFEKIIREKFGENADKLLRAYPGNTEKEIIQAANDLAGNQFIGYGTWKWSELHRRKASVYRYYYEHPRPPVFGEEERQSGEDAFKGAGHSWEIEYALGNLSTNPIYHWTPKDYYVSGIFMGYFENFIKTGNPNGFGLTDWKENTRNDPVNIMHISNNPRLMPENNKIQFEVLEEVFNTQ